MSSLKLTAHEALLFLRHYSFEDAKALGIDCSRLPEGASNTDGQFVNDVPGYITIDAVKQQVTLEVDAPGGTRTFTTTAPYDWIAKGSTPANLPQTVSRVPGTFYTRHEDPTTWTTSIITIQQYPPYDSTETSGRILMDCWTTNGVIGVFKTDNDNYVAGAHGTWA